jgi:hypothetical protein
MEENSSSGTMIKLTSSNYGICYSYMNDLLYYRDVYQSLYDTKSFITSDED